MTLSDNTIAAKALCNVFKSLAKKGNIVPKEMSKYVLKSRGRALEFGTNVGTAYSSRSIKAASSSLLEVINVYHTGKRLYFGKIVWFYAN